MPRQTPSVATVSSTGLITAVGTGTTRVTCTYRDVSSSFIVTVNIQTPSIFSVNPPGAGAGQTFSLWLSGRNFGGFTDIQFLTPAGVPDPNITISESSLLPGADSLTANVTIASNCSPGADTVVVIAAGGSSRRDSALYHNVFTILPPSNTLSLSSTTATGVETLTGKFVLYNPASPAGGTVTLTSSDPSVTVPESIWIAPGQISESFPIITSPVTTPVTVTISAFYHGTIATISPLTMPVTDRTIAVYHGTTATATLVIMPEV